MRRTRANWLWSSGRGRRRDRAKCWCASAAPAFAARICISSKALIPFSNIRASSATNCPARLPRRVRAAHRASVRGLSDPLSLLRRLRRLPARQDQLLSAHRRPRRPYRRRHGRLRLRPGRQCGGSRRRHPRSGGDGRVPGDRRPRSSPRQSAQGATASSSSAPGRSASAACIFAKLARRLGHRSRHAAGPARFLPRAGLASITRSRRGRTRVEALSALTDGDFFDIVIDATGKAQLDDGGVRLCRPWRHLRAGQRRARHDLLRRSRSSTRARSRCSAAATRPARISRRCSAPCVMGSCRPKRWPPIALRSTEAPGPLSRMDQARDRRDQGADRDLGSCRVPDPPVRHQPLPAGACRPVRQRGAGARRGDGPHRRRADDVEPGEPEAPRSLRRGQAIPSFGSRASRAATVVDRERRGRERRRRRRRQRRNGPTSSACSTRPVARSRTPPTAATRPIPRTGRTAGRRDRFRPSSPSCSLARHRAGAEPITLFPCELTPANGAALRAVVLRRARSIGMRRARRGAGSASDCVWVNSLVDRIVSRAARAARRGGRALRALGDRGSARPGAALPSRRTIKVTERPQALRAAEAVHPQPGPYLSRRDLGARSHGAPTLTVREAMADRGDARRTRRALSTRKCCPSSPVSGWRQRRAPIATPSIDRFSNPFLDHRLAEIFVNHESKKQRRFGGLIALAEANGVQCPPAAAEGGARIRTGGLRTCSLRMMPSVARRRMLRVAG